VRSAICVNRKEIAHTPLEAVANANNSYSLIAIFRGGHLAIKSDGAVYVTALVEVVPQPHKNCIEEFPEIHNGTEIFVDLISHILKPAGLPVQSYDVASSHYKLGRKWYYNYLKPMECHDPAMLPVNEVQIDSLKMSDKDSKHAFLPESANLIANSFGIHVSPSAKIATWRYWFRLSCDVWWYGGNRSFASYTKTKKVESAV
jgi:hypothetical protein